MADRQAEWVLNMLVRGGVLREYTEANVKAVQGVGMANSLVLAAAGGFVNGGLSDKEAEVLRQMLKTLWSGGGVVFPAELPL